VSDERAERVIGQRVRRACWLALAALALIAGSLIHPSPLPIVVAMSVGQVLGTLSLVLFLHAIFADALRPKPPE
jgi:hypothetical protein